MPLRGHYVGVYVAGVAAVVLGLWMLTCLIWPYKPCPTCKGGGKRRAPVGISWRKCARCKGSGEVLRAGRRMIGKR